MIMSDGVGGCILYDVPALLGVSQWGLHMVCGLHGLVRSIMLSYKYAQDTILVGSKTLPCNMRYLPILPSNPRKNSTLKTSSLLQRLSSLGHGVRRGCLIIRHLSTSYICHVPLFCLEANL